MELGIKDRNALVTGGAAGIGEAIVRQLVEAGVNVYFTSRNRERGEKLEAELASAPGEHRFWHVDVGGEGEPKKLNQKLLDAGFTPSILVNNIGDTLGITDPFCGIEQWKKVYRLNLEVHVEMVDLFVPPMVEAGWGRVVNITAGAALENSGPVPYCSIKAAYTAYTRSMARVLAPTGVVMSAVLPGVVFTEGGHWEEVLATRPEHAAAYLENRTVLKRFGEPREISPFVVLLCSELASFAVGAIVPVEGGQARHYFSGNLDTFQ